MDHSLDVANLPSKNDIDRNTISSVDINKEERASELPLTSVKEESGKAEEEKPTTLTFKGSPEVQETDIDTDTKL